VRERPGIAAATKLVADRAAGIGRLTLQLALTELKQKVAALSAGLALLAGAAVFGLFALAFALAGAAAALALVLSTWLAVLVVAAALLVLAGALGMTGLALLRRGAPPVPEQALEQVKLTAQVVRNGH
jgi:apolipoprotein N-acyltransferase